MKVLKCKDEIDQRLDLNKQMNKNGVICPDIMFTPGIMVIKISKLDNFLYFLLMIAKNQSQFEQKI